MDRYRERLERLGKQLLISTRNEIYLSMRFFEAPLHRFSYELSLSTQSVGTDGLVFYYNPKFLLEIYDKSPADLNRAYLHVLLHCLFGHLFKAERKASDGSFEWEESRWDLACDIVVESIMDSWEEIACVLQVSSPYREEIYQNLAASMPVLTAEGVYRRLKVMAAGQAEYERLKKEFYVDDHSFWRNQSPEGSQPRREKQPELEKIWEDLAKKTQTAMETFYCGIGKKAGNLQMMLNVRNRRTEDYRQFLKQFAVVREEMRLDPDSFDYIPYCFGMNGYGKEKQKIPLIEPLEVKEVSGIDEFAIAVDTSGSVSRENVRRFLEETVQILKSQESFFRKVKIHVLECDAGVQKDLVIRSGEDIDKLLGEIEVSGFGGTDFCPVFSYLESLSESGAFSKLRGLLYFTDGFGTFPEKPPSFPSAFILPSAQAMEPKIPPWAIKVVVDYEKETGDRYEY